MFTMRMIELLTEWGWEITVSSSATIESLDEVFTVKATHYQHSEIIVTSIYLGGAIAEVYKTARHLENEID